MIFISKILKGHSSLKYVVGVEIFLLCTLSNDGLYLNKVS